MQQYYIFLVVSQSFENVLSLNSVTAFERSEEDE